MVNMEPTGSDAYKARRLQHNLAKLRIAEKSMISYFQERGQDTTAQSNHLAEKVHCLRSFEELEPEIQSWILERVNCQSREIPILAYYIDHESWMLITSRQMIWSSPTNGKIMQLAYTAITRVSSSLGPGGSWSDWVDAKEAEKTGATAPFDKLAHVASPWILIKQSNASQNEFVVPQLIKHELLEQLSFITRIANIHPPSPD